MGFLSLAGVMAALCVVIAMEVASPVLPDPGAGTGIRPAVRQPTFAAATRVPAEDHTDAWVATSLARPLFTRDRKPVGEHGTATAGATEVLPRLAGIAISPYGRRAIFAGDDGKPVVVREGGSVAGYTVRAIQPDLVRIDGPDGQRSLAPAFDPKAHPAETPQVAGPYGQAPIYPGQVPGGVMPPMRMPGMPLQLPFRPRVGNGAAWIPSGFGYPARALAEAADVPAVVLASRR